MLKRLFLLLVVVAIPTTKLQAANDSFVGKWKLNPERSTMHDQMKVNSAGTNRYAFDFGGGPEFIVANGTDQPGLEGTTLAVTAEAPRVWRVVRKKNGRMQISAIWTLSTRCATTSPATRPTAPVSLSITSTHPLDERLALLLRGIASAKSPAGWKSRCSPINTAAFPSSIRHSTPRKI